MSIPKVSVIVPIFNVETYIERCARSLFEQSLKDIEYIFVDDCTPDNSIIILQKVLMEYPNRIPQTTIIHHDVNKGIAAARQSGLRIVSGAFIAHCDSDDWVERNIYEAMYETASREDADVVVCDYYVTDGTNSKIKVQGCHNTDITEFLTNCLYQIDSWSIWNKLVKREKYDGIKFPLYSMGEDLVVSIQLLARSSKMSYCSEPYYNYTINASSITNAMTVEHCEWRYIQMKSNVSCLIDALFDCNFSGRTKGGFSYLKYNVLTMLLPVVHKKEFYKKWKTAYKGLNKELLFSKYMPFDIKVKYILTALRLYPNRSVRID